MSEPGPTAVVDGRVSVIVLNWNSGVLGAAVVASARAQDWPDVEVIVVDNASTDGSLERIVASHPDVAVVRHDRNLGFALGMNRGITGASGEYVVPLNCDAELDPAYVRTLVEVLEREPRAAAAGGRVTSPRVGSSGPLAVTATMRTRSLPVDRALACDKVNGACPVFRRAALDQVIETVGAGPYADDYDTYGEDVDLALTLGRLGWWYVYEPAARATHVRSFASAPRLADRSGRLRVSTLANRHRNIVRHGAWWVAVDLLAGAQDAAFALARLATGDRSAPGDVLSAWRVHLRRLPADLRRRRRLPPRRPRPGVVAFSTTQRRLERHQAWG